MKLRIAMLAPLLLLAACATPSQKIAAKLTEVGVPQPQARCMGDRLQSRLTLTQLRRLDEVVRLNRDRVGNMSINQIARALDDPGDPALFAEVVRAGVGCLI